MQKAIFFLLFLSFQNSFAQKQDNNWVFGRNAGLNFDSGSPQPFTANIYSVEDCASISDTSGQLLFYTNGVNVYNRLGEIMPNGDSLATGFLWQYGADAPQSVLILQEPDSNHLYYLFTRSDSRLSYSIINMNLDSSLGDLPVKNLWLYDEPVQRYMTAIRHGNGKDWWLITHGLQSKFMAWKISSSGIDPPVISSIGLFYNYAGFNSHVEIVSNLQGNQLAFSSANGIHIVDFDRCHGTFDNFQTIALPETPYSFAYSPNGTRLYFSFHYNFFPTYLRQLCLDCIGPLDSNIIEIFHNFNLNYNLGQIQNGPDGKIYVTMGYGWATDTITDFYNLNLSVINDPDQLGMACDFDTATISLGGNYSLFGLPNSPYYNMPSVVPDCNDSIAVSSSVAEESFPRLYPDPARDFLFVHLPGNKNTLVSCYIYDNLGRCVMHGEKNFFLNGQIDIRSLHRGVYYMIIRDKNSILLKEEFIRQ